MKSTTRLVSDNLFETEMNGIKVRLDTGSDDKKNLSPVENLLPSIASCSVIDIVDIMKKKRKEVRAIEVHTEAMRRTEPIPKIITGFHLKFILTSSNASEKDLEQAVRLSMDKYCTVSAMLSPVAKITYEWEIIP